MGILGCSRSTARMLLIHYRWNTENLFGASAISAVDGVQHLWYPKHGIVLGLTRACSTGTFAEAGQERVYKAAGVTSSSSHAPATTGAHHAYVFLQGTLYLVQGYCIGSECSCLPGLSRWPDARLGTLMRESSIMKGGCVAALEGEVSCACCFCDVAAEEATSMECGHAFCNSCWSQHFRVQIQEGNSRRLKCMGEKCGAICDEDKVLIVPTHSEQ